MDKIKSLTNAGVVVSVFLQTEEKKQRITAYLSTDGTCQLKDVQSNIQ